MLEIENLTASYDEGGTVLEDLSFTVGADEFVALMGRNGAGKTTTFKSIVGFVPEVDGRIEFDGESIARVPPQDVFDRGVAWVPEDRRVFDNLSVRDNLRVGNGGRASADRLELVYDTFPRLEERTAQIAGTMSGGEQQMLALGRAMMSDPDLLLIDEPFEGLMPTLITELLEVFRSFRDRDVAILVAGHQNDEVLEIADRVEVIDAGQIVFSGDARTLAEDRELRERHLGVKQR